MQQNYFELRDRIYQFLVDMMKVASSVRVARAFQCVSGSKKGKRAGYSRSCTIGSRPRSSATNLSWKRQLSVKLNQLYLSQVKKDL